MKRLHDERGQTMVEFAIVLPVLCLLLFGAIQFGILFNNYVTLTDAVRAGARKAAVSRQITGTTPQQACIDQVKASASDLDTSKLTVSCASDWQPTSSTSAAIPSSDTRTTTVRTSDWPRSFRVGVTRRAPWSTPSGTPTSRRARRG